MSHLTIRHHHQPNAKQLQSTYHRRWMNMCCILTGEKYVTHIPIHQTLLKKENPWEVIPLGLNMINVLKPEMCIEVHRILLDDKLIYNNTLYYRINGDVLYILQNNGKLDILREVDGNLEVEERIHIGVYELDFMDVLYDGMNRNHIILIVCLQKLYIHETKRNKLRIHSLRDLNWINIFLTSERGDYVIIYSTGMYYSKTKQMYENLDYISSICNLYNTKKWFVNCIDAIYFLNDEGMDLFITQGSRAVLYGIESENLLNNIYINTTNDAIEINKEHDIAVYIYRNRVCIAQITPPYEIFPVIQLEIGTIIKYINYNASKNELKLFSYSSIQTFKMDFRSLTASTKMATTFE